MKWSSHGHRYSSNSSISGISPWRLQSVFRLEERAAHRVREGPRALDGECLTADEQIVTSIQHI
jgi:hypothetical protein